ncbi:D-alanyl-D-alanine carboxypeptidase [Aeromonas encheleia]|jgi:D-alanyl-D-alanine endopeptidase (penicillin-binding protein 7)|uniref:D-alanyl-D-alanine endopeptidase n=1 Tax=Aeromonas encheleia TaxID=73010 RepID=A0AAE9SDQ2_9GAMM|nr:MULTISPECIES: D-alanyl-D-alanine endopeptidase [Aeromonas]MBV7414756.1 D-alanyl-D-alanine endopeptidase [Aeromonas sp. sif2433]MBV7437444.1 D-alanyl-D-alanine endopeptidase [Aeromonas sp. sif2416]MBV7598115.1 D-alanyl-D-alanine endopeptidase [Aeromonas sp. sia0103]UNP89985.1 D-alanyl-D-alanine endopeptidase [Aeromonas encheleia]USV59210.1 D-alanyl-D-alanine endopeptidase [Aeromonas encheleia]
MNLRPFLPVLLGAFLLPVSMESAHANPFSATSSSTNSLIQTRNNLSLSSDAFVVANSRTGEILAERNADRVMPIASITKLMTALVVLDGNQRLADPITVTMDDVDRIKGTGSRLAIGSRLSRADMLHIALMSSENRAASALARHYPGGRRAFVEAMNAKARMLGMWDTHFADSTGLNPRNVSSAHDLAKLAATASSYPLIRQYTSTEHRLVRNGKRQMQYHNSNRLVREGNWPILVSKTGYIREAGRCLVMGTTVSNEPVIMVLLHADTTAERVADAKRIKTWLETSGRMTLTAQSTPQTKLFSAP